MTIFHKSILAGACQVVSRGDSVYNSVLLQKDGTVVAANEQVRYIAEPSSAAIYESLPFGNKTGLFSDAMITAEQIENLIKMVPVDKQFKGALEHIDISHYDHGAGTPILSALFNDGHGEARFTLRAQGYISPVLNNYRNLLQSLGEGQYSQKELLINRAQLGQVFNALQSACRYDGRFSFIKQRAFDKGYIWVCLNELTQQHVVIVFTLTEAAMGIEYGTWEKSIFNKVNTPGVVPVVPNIKVLTRGKRCHINEDADIPF